MNQITKFELKVLIEKNKPSNEKKLDTEIQKLFSRNTQLREINLVTFQKSR